jgi:hypothetical protein
MREVWRLEEVDREAKRLREREAKELMEKQRKEVMISQQKRAQAAAAALIERATEHLLSVKSTEETRLANQQAEKMAKDEASAKEQADKRAKFMESVWRSRESQIALRKSRKDEKEAQDREFAAQWRVQQKRIDEEE